MEYDIELARALRIDEAVEVVMASPRILIGMSFAFIILVTNLGLSALYGWAAIPALVIAAMIFLAMRGFFRLRHRERPDDISQKRIRSFLIFAITMGAGWGSMLSIIIVSGDGKSQLVALLLAFIGTFATTSINSTRVAMGFGFTTLGIIWLTVLWTGLLPPIGASVLFVLAYLTITYFAQQAHLARVVATKQTIANTKAMKAQFQAEEQLREAQFQTAQLEHDRQLEVSATQRNVINAIPFPLILAHYNTLLEITPAARRQFGLDNGAELANVQLEKFFIDPSVPKRILQTVKTDGKLNDLEALMTDTKGNQFWVTISTRALIYEGKKSWLHAIYVIDARKRMEQELGNARDQAVEALAELRKTQEQLVHSEKMAGLGQLTAGIAHEIKNPLNFVNNFAKLSTEMLDELIEILNASVTYNEQDACEDAEDILTTIRGNLIKIDQHGSRADSIVKNMLSHSREGSGEREEIPLNSLVEEALNLSYHGARASDTSINVEIEKDWSGDVTTVLGVSQELQRVFLNLFSNGIYAADKHARERDMLGKLTVSSSVDAENFAVQITDNGAGIPQDNLQKIFEPFYTTKPSGEGTGLGLSMSFDIIRAHGGTIDVHSSPETGTVFSVRLPRNLNKKD